MHRCGVRVRGVCMAGVCMARMCVPRLCVSRVHLGGVSVAGVAVAVSAVSVATMSGVSTVPVSTMSDVGEAADRHRGEASTAKREAEPINVHSIKYYVSDGRLVTGCRRQPGRTHEGHADGCRRALQVLHESIVPAAQTGKRISRYFGSGQQSSDTVSSI
jgi:hypothetical protein